MFEKALRQRLVFETKIGRLSTEDMWHIPLPILDEAARALRRQVNELEEESFITPTNSNAKQEVSLKFEIVKHIIATKLTERDAAVKKQEIAKKRQEILALIDEKQSETLKQKSVEELFAELETLEG